MLLDRCGSFRLATKSEIRKHSLSRQRHDRISANRASYLIAFPPARRRLQSSTDTPPPSRSHCARPAGLWILRPAVPGADDLAVFNLPCPAVRRGAGKHCPWRYKLPSTLAMQIVFPPQGNSLARICSRKFGCASQLHEVRHIVQIELESSREGHGLERCR